MNNERQGTRRIEGTQYQRTIHRQILEENKTETVQEKFFCCYGLAQFLKKELFRYRDKSECHTQSGFALSVTKAVAVHSECCRVLFLNMKNSEVENLWGLVFCSLCRILFPLCLWLLSKPSKRLSSGYIRHIVLKQWHMETSTSSERFMLLNVV